MSRPPQQFTTIQCRGCKALPFETLDQYNEHRCGDYPPHNTELRDAPSSTPPETVRPAPKPIAVNERATEPFPNLPRVVHADGTPAPSIATFFVGGATEAQHSLISTLIDERRHDERTQQIEQTFNRACESETLTHARAKKAIELLLAIPRPQKGKRK